MTALTLIDANGNPITCGALDVAGDPTAFAGNPVVELQADGTFALAEQVAGGIIGLGTNWDWRYSSNFVRQAFILANDQEEYKLISDVNGVTMYATGNVYRYMTVGQYLGGLAGASGKEFEFVAVDMGEDPNHIGYQMSFEYINSSTEALDLVAVMNLLDSSRWNGPEANSAALDFTYDIHAVSFDDATFNSGTKHIDLTGANVEATQSVEQASATDEYGYDSSNPRWDDVTSGQTALYPDVVRYYFPFTIPAGKKWTLYISNVTCNGAAITATDVTLGFIPRIHLAQ